MRISDWSSDVCSSDLLIPSIPPSEVKSVEIIKFAKNFSRLYMEAVPNANPMEIPATGSVIAIYTYVRRGIFGVQTPQGNLKANVQVSSTQRSFYTPPYEYPTYQKFNPQTKGIKGKRLR